MSEKPQMTVTTWIAIVIAAIGATSTVSSSIRANYYQRAASQLVTRENARIDTLQGIVFDNRIDISVVKNDISTIKNDIQDIKAGLGIGPQGKK